MTGRQEVQSIHRNRRKRERRWSGKSNEFELLFILPTTETPSVLSAAVCRWLRLDPDHLRRTLHFPSFSSSLIERLALLRLRRPVSESLLGFLGKIPAHYARLEQKYVFNTEKCTRGLNNKSVHVDAATVVDPYGNKPPTASQIWLKVVILQKRQRLRNCFKWLSLVWMMTLFHIQRRK